MNIPTASQIQDWIQADAREKSTNRSFQTALAAQSQAQASWWESLKNRLDRIESTHSDLQSDLQNAR